VQKQGRTIMNRSIKTLVIMWGMVLAITGCGSPDPEGGTGNPDGGGGNVGGAVTQEKFVADFYKISCGPSNTEGAMPSACAMSNAVAVNLFSCLWRRADFGNDGQNTDISDTLRMQLSDGGSTPLCSSVLKTTSCTDYMRFTFGGGTPADVHIANIWKNSSDPKPTNAEGMLGSCNISP
jgi:hypothetical protein